MKRVIIYDSLLVSAKTARKSCGFENGTMMLWPVNDKTEEYRFRLTFLDGDSLYREVDVLSGEYSNTICEIYVHDDKVPIKEADDLRLYAVCIEFSMDNKKRGKLGRFDVVNTRVPVFFKDYKKAKSFANGLMFDDRNLPIEILIIRLNGKRACEFNCSATYFKYPLGALFHWNEDEGVIYECSEVEEC